MNLEVIFAVMNTTWAVDKIRRKKIQACKGLNFSVVFRNAKIVSIFTSLTAIHIYDFYIFMVIYSPLHGFIYDQHNDQL